LGASLGVTSLEFRRYLWHQKTRVLRLSYWRCLLDLRFSHLSRTCDRQTDRQMWRTS